MTEHAGGGDINRSLALMWGLDDRANTGPRAQLTLERIVEQAIAVADAEGLDAVSMRRVATDLGVGTMSLYRHVPGKAELLDLMLEHVNAPSEDALPAGWRPAMETLGRGLWQLYTAHVWLPFVDQTTPLLGPNALRGLEIALASLVDTPLTDRQKILVISVLDSFANASARTHNSARLAESRTGVTAEEFWAAQEPVLTIAMTSGDYPLLSALDPTAWDGDAEATFEFGLQSLLDGFAPLFAPSE